MTPAQADSAVADGETKASVLLRSRRETAGYLPPFEVIDFRVTVGRHSNGETYAEATVKLRIGEQLTHTAAGGNGPVSALDCALRKALTPSYPEVEDVQLADYKVRILDESEGTSAVSRVVIDSRDAQRAWSTTGTSANIIDASLSALVDSLEFALLER